MPIVAKLDELGRPAWIALMILGFWFWWPLGLATLAFIIGSGRMSCWNHHGMDHWQRKMERMQNEVNEFMEYVKHELARGLGDWEQRLNTALVPTAPSELLKK